MRSIWIESVENDRVDHPALEGDIKTDVLVVGGGMAGILTAHFLKAAGVDCAVIEARTVGSGTTGSTTAKITAQHGLIYSHILPRLGEEYARLYYMANTEAIDAYRSLAAEQDCDLADSRACVYSLDDREKLDREARACQRLSIPFRMEEEPPLPFPSVGAIAMERQAHFNPMKLLNSLSSELNIYENTMAAKIDGLTAVTPRGRITAEAVVLSTHYPLVNIPGFYFLKLFQSRSYVIALERSGHDGAPAIDGMYVDEKEDGYSFRPYKNLLLIGGGDHRTGGEGDGCPELNSLAKWAYPGSAISYSWAAQDCMSLDGLPYIGRHMSGKENLYVASGFNKWGMTGSMVAAKTLCELILNGKSRYESLFSPRRSLLTAQLAVNASAAVAGLLSPGRPRCTHMGCRLNWNSTDKTWDCPCHGSRFDICGSVLDNPAIRDIEL